MPYVVLTLMFAIPATVLLWFIVRPLPDPYEEAAKLNRERQKRSDVRSG